eukprot:2134002-Rhodomonas_salina.1
MRQTWIKPDDKPKKSKIVGERDDAPVGGRGRRVGHGRGAGRLRPADAVVGSRHVVVELRAGAEARRVHAVRVPAGAARSAVSSVHRSQDAPADAHRHTRTDNNKHT